MSEQLPIDQKLYERALKAAGRWSKQVYKREGTVPTRPEWYEWIDNWMERNRGT